MSDDIKNEGLEPSLSSSDDILSMSDDDILNMAFPEPQADEAPQGAEDEPEGEEVNYEEELSPESTDEPSDEYDDEVQEGEEDFETDEDDSEDSSTEDEDDLVSNEDVDYKAKYEELLAPFKANGKEIKVDSAEDLRRLAQMGVGYNARMAELKPIRKIAKMLENEGLLDEAKLNHLIDLSKGNVNAINKLVKDSGINPLDIDTEGTEGYKPNTYTVDDNQLALDEALGDLERTTSGQKVIDVVSTKWDDKSKGVLVSNPAMLRDLESHIENGIFDKVMAEVEKEKLFNRIPAGVSDLDAYNFIGQQLASRGVFNNPSAEPKAEPKVKAQSDNKRKSRKRAAAAPKKGKPAPQVRTDVLSMSDEEFEKTLMTKYM